jgi:hypothetical protein
MDIPLQTPPLEGRGCPFDSARLSWQKLPMKRFLPVLALSLLGSPLAAQPGPADQSLRTFLQARFQQDRADFPDTRLVTAWADLNGDGRPEAIVYLISGNFCGSGGCNLLIFTPAGRSWRTVAQMSVTNPPIRLLGTSSHGWRDLAVTVSGGGVRRHEVLMSFNGQTYPGNPTVPPARAFRRTVPGRVLISDSDPAQPLF